MHMLTPFFGTCQSGGPKCAACENGPMLEQGRAEKNVLGLWADEASQQGGRRIASSSVYSAQVFETLDLRYTVHYLDLIYSQFINKSYQHVRLN